MHFRVHASPRAQVATLGIVPVFVRPRTCTALELKMPDTETGNLETILVVDDNETGISPAPPAGGAAGGARGRGVRHRRHVHAHAALVAQLRHEQSPRWPWMKTRRVYVTYANCQGEEF